MRRAATVLLLLACACRRTTALPTPTALAGSGSADASYAAREAEDAGAPAAAPLLPLPGAVAGTDPETVRMAASVCAASFMLSPVTKRRLVGCVGHPPFVADAQRPNGRLTEYTGDPLDFCAIEETYRGAFTKGGAKEAIVVFSQCKSLDDDTWDMGFPGSAMLVEEAGDRWREKAFRDGVNMRKCKSARKADGGDALVCDSSFSAGASGELAYVFAIDFAQPASATTLARLYSDDFDCQYGDTLPDGFSRTRVKGTAVRDANGDGVADVVVTVTRSRVAASAAMDARLKAACAGGASSPPPIRMPPDTTHRLVFTATPSGFTADAATERILATWAKEDPANYRGLAGVAP